MGVFFRRCTAEDRDALREFSIQTYSETFAQGNTAEDLEAYLQDAFDAGKLADQLNNPYSEFYFLFSDGKLAGYLKLNEAPPRQTGGMLHLWKWKGYMFPANSKERVSANT